MLPLSFCSNRCLLTGKHSPDDPKTMKRPRRPATGPTVKLSELALLSQCAYEPFVRSGESQARLPAMSIW